ncbi:MAG: ABC transporter permease, partial [Rhizobiales bacterium 17-65-6]
MSERLLSAAALRQDPSARPDYERTPETLGTIGEIQRQLSLTERLAQNAAFRRLLLLVALATIWQVYASLLGNELMLPTFTATLAALWDALAHGALLERTFYSLKVLLVGYAIGVGLAGLLVSLSASTRFGNDLLSTLTAMFNPLPAIALLPLALLWFGLGMP